MVKFVDIYNYLNPDTSYVQWVKTYEAKLWTIRACLYFKLKNECISVEDYQSI